MEGKQNFPSDISALRSVKNSFRPVSGLTSENTSDLRLPMLIHSGISQILTRLPLRGQRRTCQLNEQRTGFSFHPRSQNSGTPDYTLKVTLSRIGVKPGNSREMKII